MLLLPSRDEEYNYRPMGFDDVTVGQFVVTSHLRGLVDVTHLVSLSKMSSF